MVEGSSIIITVRATAVAGQCPTWGSSTRWVHSRYSRMALDLPLNGKLVWLARAARATPGRARKILARAGRGNLPMPGDELDAEDQPA